MMLPYRFPVLVGFHPKKEIWQKLRAVRLTTCDISSSTPFPEVVEVCSSSAASIAALKSLSASTLSPLAMAFLALSCNRMYNRLSAFGNGRPRLRRRDFFSFAGVEFLERAGLTYFG